MPNAGDYCPEKPKTDLTQSRNYKHFGANAARSNLILRNVARNPFSDPTNSKSPAPGHYQKNDVLEKKRQDVLQSVGSSIGAPEVNMTNSFYSPLKRDFFETSVPKDLKNTPGPGSYDTQIQDKLKVLNYQLSTRYHLKPFGSGASRFAYQPGQGQKQ